MERKTTISQFFAALQMAEDKENGHCYGIYMREALQAFAAKDNKQTAYEVYETFLDCYKRKLCGDNNFMDLLDTLRGYEENAALLIDKQRDHYVHSVNVFLLGIEIYQSNGKFRDAVKEYLEGRQPLAFPSAHEEFFFRWGMAALFHDIGYPVEITNNQLRKFIRVVLDDAQRDAEPFIGYQDEACLTTQPCAGKQLDFVQMLGSHLSGTLGIDGALIREKLSGFLGDMQRGGFVDHGFYSALALLHRYGFLADGDACGRRVYEGSILDAASAILLHNYYKNTLQRPPFELPPLTAGKHPLGYLLILCDEMQEWNRQAYGIVDRQKVQAADSRIEISQTSLKIHYITYQGVLAENFAEKKKRTLYGLLDLDGIFPAGVQVSATVRSELLVSEIRSRDKMLPRPFLSNIELLSKRIHERYNEAQKAAHPDKPLAYPDWNSLDDDLKYSNIRQARTYFEHLSAIGMYAAEQGDPAREVRELPPALVEALAREEHESWMAERKSSGWTYGAVKDVEKKVSPYILPYDELTEEVKQLDRDAINNILPLFHEIGLRVFRTE